ncbi:MAG: HNH endonuclease [Clostridia bacterium]|nr:HNH endonuclease [Clostridia bacterium]
MKALYDFTCINCGVRAAGRSLHAHHVVPKHCDPDVADVLENGVALCYSCHLRGVHDGKGNINDSPRARGIMRRILELKRGEIVLTVPKGQKEAIKAHADARGESVNGFIQRAIQTTMANDEGGTE